MSNDPRAIGDVRRGRIAGIDYGTVRIGVALADLEVGIATPFATYCRRGNAADGDYFRRLAHEERLIKFVVGLPVHTSGQESQKSLEARRFGRWLLETTQMDVDFFDERYSSAEAEAALASLQFTKKKRKARIDQIAAQILLTAYLEAGARSQLSPEALDS